MPADTEDYIHAHAGPPPDPPPQVRVIRSELVHSFRVPDIFITLGDPIPEHLLSDSIASSLSHV